jgi:hypothetical protein
MLRKKNQNGTRVVYLGGEGSRRREGNAGLNIVG